MTGYHYTSYSNWLKIQNEGLIPYNIKKSELQYYFDDFEGIWVWPKQLKGLAHIGSVLWQISQKADTKIVQMKFSYSKKDLLRYMTKEIKLSHSGFFGNWQYHTGKEKAVIVLHRIPPEKITLVGIYDLEKMKI